MEITILSRQRKETIDQKALRRFLESLGRRQSAGSANTLGVCFVNDLTMRESNRRFRGINRTTDVLSFPCKDETAIDGSQPLGDILISMPAARRQATEFGHPLHHEIKRLLLHGYLHLLGFDHETDQGQMEARERVLLGQLLPGAKR